MTQHDYVRNTYQPNNREVTEAIAFMFSVLMGMVLLLI